VHLRIQGHPTWFNSQAGSEGPGLEVAQRSRKALSERASEVEPLLREPRGTGGQAGIARRTPRRVHDLETHEARRTRKLAEDTGHNFLMAISEELRRFIVAKIPSVAHLEALLLLRSTATAWPLQDLSARLYVSSSTAAKLVDDLQSRGLAVRLGDNAQYLPSSERTAHAVDELSTIYRRRLIEITRLIHASTDKKAHRFADAFNVRKDS
jgi:hypothetical protein